MNIEMGNMKKELSRAYLALGIVSFFWGTTYIAARIGVRHVPGFYFSGLRQLIAGSLLVGFFLLRGYRFPNLSTLLKIGIQGVLLLCLSNGLLTWSLQYISSGLAAIISGLVPLFITLFSILMLRRVRFTWLMIAGLLTGFAGILTIFYEYLHELINPAFGFGVLLAFISVLAWTSGTVITSRYKASLPIIFTAGLQMLTAGIVTLIVCLFSGQYISLNKIPVQSWYSLSYLVVFGSFLAYSAYVYAISKLPPTLVSVYAYINPIVAVGLGWALLNEKMTLNIITGTVITLAGVYLVNREYKKQEKGVDSREPGTSVTIKQQGGLLIK